MTYTALSPKLRSEIFAVCPDDDRPALPRLARPLDQAPVPGFLRDRVLKELVLHGELETGQIAARLLRREPEVERACLTLALASLVVKLTGSGGGAYGPRWKAITSGEENA